MFDKPTTVAPVASRVAALNDNQRKVYEALRDHGPLTDHELRAAYLLQHGRLDQSRSGLRTRRRELEDANLVTLVGKKKNANNRIVNVFNSNENIN